MLRIWRDKVFFSGQKHESITGIWREKICRPRNSLWWHAFLVMNRFLENNFRKIFLTCGWLIWR
ncbi:hypothetical protein HMPREF0541_02141 [Lacticaseibacillus rhamnosus ATCC 21052]|nr:hypothetical protein HMPREF0541_02141 [Lacticaseibacillus rhamnosus ATCC 21052]